MSFRLVLCLSLAPAFAFADGPELELGLENLYYRSATSPLNQGDVLRLGVDEDLLRAGLNAKQSAGEARFVFRGYGEKSVAGATGATRWRTRQAYGQYAFGSGLQMRFGKQRVAWGSGLAWNPTNRVEPPKNPLNTSLEQEGAWAARMDVIPSRWAGLILLAARSDTGLSDLPIERVAVRRRTGAIRARFLVRDTDLALVFLGGKGQKTLWGFDVARDIFGRVSLHAEGAFHRGSEIDAARSGQSFFRLAAGGLYSAGSSSLSLEYFFNGEGQDGRSHSLYRAALDTSFAASRDPRLSPAARELALGRYLTLASVPFAGGMGLRRHYLHAAWSRSEIDGKWTLRCQATVGLTDGGVALTPGLAWAPRPDATLAVDGVILLGDAASEYRLAPIRGALQARLKVVF
jgi:hypothetical protein